MVICTVIIQHISLICHLPVKQLCPASDPNLIFHLNKTNCFLLTGRMWKGLKVFVKMNYIAASYTLKNANRMDEQSKVCSLIVIHTDICPRVTYQQWGPIFSLNISHNKNAAWPVQTSHLLLINISATTIHILFVGGLRDVIWPSLTGCWEKN